MFTSTGLIVFSVIVLGASWLLVSPKSVIWSFKEAGDPSGEPGFAIFHPFREKKSETEAEKFLNLLKNGDCEKATLNLKNQESYADICERESLHILEDWKLSNRNDTEQGVKLYYRVKRTSYSGYDGQLWIDVEKTSHGWKVTGIEAIY